MYWFELKRITPVVSAALVEMGSLISSPGVAPEIIVSLIVGARSLGIEPLQFVKLILTGMVLLYLNTLVPSALIGCRKPLVLNFTMTLVVIDPTPLSSSVTVTVAVYAPAAA